jgi:glucose-6-phosphate isomerase
MRRNELPEWRALARHCSRLRHSSIPRLFAADPKRARRWRLQAPHVEVDLSRQIAGERTRDLLLALARACEVPARRAAMFGGAIVNATEGRPAWHTALRTPAPDPNVAHRVATERERFLAVADRLRAEARNGRLERVVVIGIGGSDLGARLVTSALGPSSGPRIEFVHNIDPVALATALDGADPATTALVAISKSFTTLETIENLRVAAHWLCGPGDAGRERLYAVTCMPDRATAHRIPEENVLTFPDWVGGRFSVWSACGLPVAIAHGRNAFERLLTGAAAMDHHFLTQADESNAPLLLALLDIWNASFLRLPSRAVFPYAERLRCLPPYLQQLEMESGGKRVDADGVPVALPTAPAVWGDVGTTAQHSVFQFLHQGTWATAVEFVIVQSFSASEDPREQLLVSFAEAQADALAFGDEALPESLRPRAGHASCPGSKPSILVRIDSLQAESVGALLALYEHRTAVTSWLWNINAFDQWGVEIGKRLLESRHGALPRR